MQNIEPSPHQPGTAYAAIYRYLLGDFAPYIYRTDDFGANWRLLTDGKNGIAPDEPTRVVREDPDRAGLLNAGTEFGIYISFDNGQRWQPFQLNLPVTPVTDIKVAHRDLVVSTQGRSYWILDDLTPLHQFGKQSSEAAALLFKPREAIRTPNRNAFGMGRTSAAPQYPPSGAVLNYYLPNAADQEIAVEIVDNSDHVIRRLTATKAPERSGGEADSGDDEDGPRARSIPVVLGKTPGMHRFTWDLRYAGPWQSEGRPEGPNGPVAVPGNYKVRLIVGSAVSTQPLTIIEDPRVTASGVTQADLKEQLEHNLKVRDMVSDVNRAVARIRQAREKIASQNEKSERLNTLASHLITPSIRYSKPELQTHITYLYGMTNNTDQKVGKDAIDRYSVLRKELAQRLAELTEILGK